MEQGDLMTAIFGSHGDAPKVVMAPGTIEECFYSILTARKIAETFNMVVVILTDSGLATSQQPFRRPQFNESWLAPPVDQSPVPQGAKPYDWDDTTGLARRFIPGQPGGMHTLTGLAHDRDSHVAYDADINEQTLRFRSLKLAALQKTLKPPTVFGAAKGDLLVIGWGSTKGAIEEAVEGVCAEGYKISSLHLQFLQPLPPGIKEIMQGFKKVMTIESNWSDRPEDEIIDENNRRYSSVAILLRSRYLVDIDCWSEVRGQPIKPSTIRRVMLKQLQK
jgi:2-oxoglutarate ferredoxin oxidoreductase subunit alpha